MNFAFWAKWKYIGKTIVIEITFEDEAGNQLEKKQHFGIIRKVSDKCIAVKIIGSDDSFYLPPDLKAITKAPKGEYSFKTAGGLTVSPEYMTGFTITKKNTKK